MKLKSGKKTFVEKRNIPTEVYYVVWNEKKKRWVSNETVLLEDEQLSQLKMKKNIPLLPPKAVI